MTQLVANIVQGPIVTHLSRDPLVPFVSESQLEEQAPARFNPGAEAYARRNGRLYQFVSDSVRWNATRQSIDSDGGLVPIDVPLRELSA